MQTQLAAAQVPPGAGSLNDPVWWEGYLAQFRAACRSARPPAVRDVRAWLNPLPPEDQPLALVDLVYEHLLSSWEAGRPVLLEEYVAALGADFVEFAALSALPLDLIEHEFMVRHEFAASGDHPRIDDYVQRFPERADVREQLQSRCLDGGRYVRIKVEGKGGLGTVWAAYDQHLDRYVAVKELRTEVAGHPAILKRLRVEARVTASLEHPAIVTVHEYRPEEEAPYYVMRLVHGRTLTAVIRDYYQHAAGTAAGPQGVLWHQLLKAFTTVCEAVAYAHTRKVVHRDLKPHNIVLGAFGETVVLDWGLAKRWGGPAPGPEAGPGQGPVGPAPVGTAPLTQTDLETVERRPMEEGLTQPGQVLGTPAYMPPEQADGLTDLLGPASDIYSLGAILYELLTGQAPYRGTVLEVLQQVRQGPPPRPSQVKHGVPRALEAVCLKAMARPQEQRYATAGEAARDVERWLADEPLTVYREPVLARLKRWRRRHKPLVAGMVTALLLALLGLAGVWFVQAQRLETMRRRASDRLTEGLAQVQAGNLDRAARRLSEAVGLCGHEEELATLRARALERLGEVERSKAEGARRQINVRLVEGRAEARAGNLDRAARQLSAAVALCGHVKGLTALQAQAAQQLGQVEQYRRFRQLAGLALASPTHGVGLRGKPDVSLRLCERALAVYRVAEDPHWDRALAGTTLRAEQRAKARARMADLLEAMAIRLALYDTRDQEGARRTRRALALLDRLEALRGSTNGVWLLRTLYYRRLGEAGAADRARERLARTIPATTQDFYLMGSVLLQLGKKPREAAVAYQRALQLAPNHFGAHFGLYLCCEELKDRPGQVRAMTACLALQPNDPHLFYFRGMTYFGLRQFDLAFQDFEASTRRDPRFKQGHFYRGRMAVIGQKWALAEKDFSRTLELDAAFVPAYSWRAIARAKLKQHRGAVEDAERAVQLERWGTDTHLYAARAYAQAVAAVQAATTELQRRQLAQKYADRCVELLERALRLGFTDRQRLGPGSDFDPVRTHPGFRTIIAGKDRVPD